MPTNTYEKSEITSLTKIIRVATHVGKKKNILRYSDIELSMAWKSKERLTLKL